MTPPPTTEPDLTIEKLKIWIHSRQYPDASNHDDAAWLNVTIRYDSGWSSTEVAGPIMRINDIKHFLEDCEKATQGQTQEIELVTIEAHINLTLELDALGHMQGLLKLRPNHQSEKHEYTLDMDQSDLPLIIHQCKTILTAYPVKDGKSEK